MNVCNINETVFTFCTKQLCFLDILFTKLTFQNDYYLVNLDLDCVSKYYVMLKIHERNILTYDSEYLFEFRVPSVLQ